MTPSSHPPASVDRPSPDPRANPLALGPLVTRSDVQRAVRDLYEPLVAHTSRSGALVRLGSHAALFSQRVAELEGFARPLYGIVPLTVGGGRFDHWDRIASGLDAGTDPASPDYWGAVPGNTDQRMVEQAAIGLAMAFCPERCWEPLSSAAQDRVVAWLHGIFDWDPAPNNWQFFRVLVSLGLERVGRSFDRSKVDESIAMLESYRRGEHWYLDGRIANVDYYVPFAFHTYGLMYVAANKLGLGSDAQAARYAERAAGFGNDFVNWFGPDGAGIPYGRSLTYRFAMASYWGALAWADVEAVPWGVAKGMSLRHLRWWADQPISDRDGVVPIGFAYDNRRLAEAYNSAGSPYWCMKYFAGLSAPEDHPFWVADEADQPTTDGPITITDAGWVTDRDADHAVCFVGRQGLPFEFMEQTAAKYDKFAYSSVFGFSGDVEPAFQQATTDSTLSLTDAGGRRLSRHATVAGGVEDGCAWSTWFPWDDVRVDSVVWGGTPWHGRIHRIRTGRSLSAEESGFAVADEPDALRSIDGADHATVAKVVGANGCSAIIDLSGERRAKVRTLPVNANIMHPHARVPLLIGDLGPGEHLLSSIVFASPSADTVADDQPSISAVAQALLDRISAADAAPWPSIADIRAMLTTDGDRP
jgi:hypothetical protein